MKKKERRKIDAVIAKLIEANKEGIESALDRDGIIELVLDIGDGKKISLGTLVK